MGQGPPSRARPRSPPPATSPPGVAGGRRSHRRPLRPLRGREAPASRLVDFDDLLARYTGALEGDSRFAAAQRWRWRHVFVDELQDVNPLQYRMLMALLGDNDDLFVVGDPNQAIYGWNGSDPAFLANFPERWPAAEVVRLDDNHRSSPQVVAAASSVLGRQATAARSSRPDGPLPRLRCYPSEEAEAAGVAAQVLAARARGLRWDQMAVLVRANSQASVIAQALRRAGVPLQAVASADSSQLREEEPDVGHGQRGRHRVHLPPRQGTAMGSGVGLRAGNRLRPDRLRLDSDRSGRRTSPPVRGPEPGRTRALLLVGQEETLEQWGHVVA